MPGWVSRFPQLNIPSHTLPLPRRSAWQRLLCALPNIRMRVMKWSQ